MARVEGRRQQPRAAVLVEPCSRRNPFRLEPDNDLHAPCVGVFGDRPEPSGKPLRVDFPGSHLWPAVLLDIPPAAGSAISPERDQLAYVDLTSFQKQIMVFDLNAGKNTVVLTRKEYGAIDFPKWQGSTILFHILFTEGLFLLNPDGSGLDEI